MAANPQHKPNMKTPEMSAISAFLKIAITFGTVTKAIVQETMSSAQMDQISQVASHDHCFVFFMGNEKLPVITPFNNPSNKPHNAVISYSSATVFWIIAAIIN